MQRVRALKMQRVRALIEAKIKTFERSITAQSITNHQFSQRSAILSSLTTPASGRCLRCICPPVKIRKDSSIWPTTTTSKPNQTTTSKPNHTSSILQSICSWQRILERVSLQDNGLQGNWSNIVQGSRKLKLKLC